MAELARYFNLVRYFKRRFHFMIHQEYEAVLYGL